MAIGSFIGGRYSGSWTSGNLGITRDGWDLVLQPLAELINQSDAYAQTLLDFFFAGCNVDIITSGMEYTSMIPAAWPWGTYGAQGAISRLGSGLAGSLALSATAGTPAAGNPNSLTGSRAIMAPSSQSTIKHTSKLREVPMRWNLLPSDGLVHFTTS